MGCGSSNQVQDSNMLTNDNRTVSRQASQINKRSQIRTKSLKMNALNAEATFAGESFYVMEACFKTIPGVNKVKSGYCTVKGVGIQSVQLTFDANKITYANLLDSLFAMHDVAAPQKEDQTIQSVIFTHDADQAAQAKIYLDTIQKTISVKIRTQSIPYTSFNIDNEATNYHMTNFNSEMSLTDINPKLKKFQSYLDKKGIKNQSMMEIQ